jgi:hypothetical protein
MVTLPRSTTFTSSPTVTANHPRTASSSLSWKIAQNTSLETQNTTRPAQKSMACQERHIDAAIIWRGLHHFFSGRVGRVRILHMFISADTVIAVVAARLLVLHDTRSRQTHPPTETSSSQTSTQQAPMQTSTQHSKCDQATTGSYMRGYSSTLRHRHHSYCPPKSRAAKHWVYWRCRRKLRRRQSTTDWRDGVRL